MTPPSIGQLMKSNIGNRQGILQVDLEIGLKAMAGGMTLKKLNFEAA